MTQQHILISLEPRHAENILSGLKRVELRRRTMNVAPGSFVWFYSKLPVGSVVGRALVTETRSMSPKSLWREFGALSGLTKQEFFQYFDGVSEGVALVLTTPERLVRSMTLQTLRRSLGRFYPPQFFVRIGDDHPVLRARLAAA